MREKQLRERNPDKAKDPSVVEAKESEAPAQGSSEQRDTDLIQLDTSVEMCSSTSTHSPVEVTSVFHEQDQASASPVSVRAGSQSLYPLEGQDGTKDATRLEELIKNLTKTCAVNHVEEINEKEKLEHGPIPKLNLVSIPNNQTHKSVNHGSAKPLPPEHIKCNILKGTTAESAISRSNSVTCFHAARVDEEKRKTPQTVSTSNDAAPKLSHEYVSIAYRLFLNYFSIWFHVVL